MEKPAGAAAAENGYVRVRRAWKKGDSLELTLRMDIEKIHADPRVRADYGKLAIQRGPLVYCLEQVDNGPDLFRVSLPEQSELKTVDRPDLLGGVTAISGRGKAPALVLTRGDAVRRRAQNRGRRGKAAALHPVLRVGQPGRGRNDRVGAAMIPLGTGEAHSMEDGLRLDFVRPFEPVEASHVLAERPGTRVIRQGGSVCLVFSAHGGLVVEDGRTAWELQANAALLLEPCASGPVRIVNRAESDFYVLRFRWAHTGVQHGQVLQLPAHATVLRPARLTHLLGMYVEKAKGQGPAVALILHHLLVLALCELARSSQDGMLIPAREPGLASIASRVDAFIAAHYHETISTPDIAAELRYNPDYLERSYRQERGISIREAIHTRRINEARAQLLLLRQQGVAQIAAMCGYTDAGYFRRLFKRATHMTPHGYRAVHTAFLPDDGARAQKALRP